MSPRALILPLLLALLAGPLQAAGPAKEKGDKAEEDVDPAAGLPNSMRQHGVIGHVPPSIGLPLFDPAVLARMRERLVIQAREGGT